MIRTKTIRVVTAIVMLMHLAFAQSGQVAKTASPVSVLERQVPEVDSQYLTTVDAFSLALNYAGVPGGIIKIGNCEEDTFKQPLRTQGLSLREVLKTIATADPRYRWVHEDGVVNLIPSMGEPDLLKVRIAEFDAESVASADAALSRLLALPEVKGRIAELRLKHGLTLFVSPVSPNPTRFDVHCKSVTLREALNAIARAQTRAVWDYVEIHCGGRDEVVIRF